MYKSQLVQVQAVRQIDKDHNLSLGHNKFIRMEIEFIIAKF